MMEPAYEVPTVSIVGEGFCVPYPVELIVKKKAKGLLRLFDSRFEVSDVNGNLYLQVDGKSLAFQCKRVMCDPAGFPVLTLHEKAITTHYHWTVHHGESSEPYNLLFSVQESHSPTKNSVAYNNLSRKPPDGTTQFITFEQGSYEVNPLLWWTAIANLQHTRFTTISTRSLN